MDKLKKLQDLSNLQSEPSLVLYERVEETLDKIDQLTEKVGKKLLDKGTFIALS